MRGTSKYATLFKVTGSPMVVITDADGTEIHRASIAEGESALSAAWAEALRKYAPKPVSWKEEASVAASRKLLVVGFDDEPGEALKVLEDRSIAKFHDRIEFVKRPARKDGEAAKKWGVSTFPALILADASQENPEKAPLEKLIGKKSPASVRAAIQKALARLESRK